MSGTSLPLAGFQVIIIGRFWVITEAIWCESFYSRGMVL